MNTPKAQSWVTSLLLIYASIVIVSVIIDVTFFSFKIADYSTTPTTFRTDYTGLLRALPFVLLASTAAYLLRYRNRIGYWFTLTVATLGTALHGLSLTVTVPSLLTTFSTVPFEINALTLSLLHPSVTTAVLFLIAMIIFVLLIKVRKNTAAT